MSLLLKIIIIGIIIIIFVLIGYIIYLYKKDLETKNKKEIKNKKVIIKDNPKNLNFKIENLANSWQKELLQEIIKERLESLKNFEKLNSDELEILSKLIEKKQQINDFNNLIEITKNNKTYGILNIAILDYLYKIISKKDREQDVKKAIYLLDCVNGGIPLKKEKLYCFPENLDINGTLIKILDNNLKNDSNKLKLPKESIKKACIDLASNGGYLNLNWAARQVLSRIILDNIGDCVYSYNNIKILSDENKIYLRLLAIIISNEDYEEMVESLI